jgi:hypothetical protein
MHPLAFTGLFFLLVLFAFAMPHMPPDHSEVSEEGVSEGTNLEKPEGVSIADRDP